MRLPQLKLQQNNRPTCRGGGYVKGRISNDGGPPFLILNCKISHFFLDDFF